MRYLMCAAVAALLLPATVARAHYLWIEPAGDHLELRFGEYQEKLRETASTRLPEFPGPRGKLLRAGQWRAVPLLREQDGFAFPASGRGAVAEDTGVAVKDLTKSNIGIVKPIYYARHAKVGARETARQVLDVIPRGPGRVGVFFRGKPLADAVVTRIGPDLVEHRLATDAKGEIALEQLAPGMTVFDAVHLEAASGSFEAVAYQAVRHRATLTFVVR